MDESPKAIVILGGSYAGISVAHYVLKHVIPSVPSSSQYTVVLISTSKETFCRPASPRALISDGFFPQDKLFVDIPTSFAQYPPTSFKFVHGTATKLDHVARTVSITVANTDENEEAQQPLTINYHALVIATGSRTLSPLLGLTKDSTHLRDNWNQFRKALPMAKHIAIAGGGASSIETAGELAEYLNGSPTNWFGFGRQSKPKVAITVICADKKILPALRPVLAKKAEQYLADLGVTVIKNARVVAVSPAKAGLDGGVGEKAILTLKDGSTLDADLYIPAIGTLPNSAFVDDELLTSKGQVDTNPQTLRVDKAGPMVYAIGDVASYARPAIHLILEAVPVLCTNLKRDLLADIVARGASTTRSIGVSVKPAVPSTDRIYKEDTRETQLVPIGRSRGVGAAMGWSLPGWLIWLIKGRDYWLWTTGPLWSGKQWAKPS